MSKLFELSSFLFIVAIHDPLTVMLAERNILHPSIPQQSDLAATTGMSRGLASLDAAW